MIRVDQLLHLIHGIQFKVPIDRKFHIECFCKFPLKGIETYDNIIWNELSDNNLIPTAENLFSEYSSEDQSIETRKTMQVYEGMREVSKILQRDLGMSGTQSLKFLKESMKDQIESISN